MERLKLFMPLIAFVVLAALLFNGLKNDPNELKSVLLGKPVPAFALPSLNDESRIITQDTFKGKPYLLNVWATWCPSCKVEHPYLLELANMGITIVGLNYKDESDEARSLLKAMEDPYVDNIVDADGRLGLDLGVYGAPETFVVDASGIIRFKVVGVVTEEIWARDIAPIFFGG
ncbi:DsbE family thiol:disulfide interchange protein [Marinagarivorans algicola]|uniref:DsbE family thiol:disulfide interchange protein n=1 Tax=Marinagarivorans algicola TaxID=1513270 RepID=UPI0006B9C4A4|nr:DsbE family thiol:disulfide interchange protein [Marinagarivorans algicola]